MNHLQVFIEAVKNVKTVGTVTFSSKFLSKTIVSPIDFDTAQYIVELGAGNGCITKQLLQNMRPDAKLLAFEINEKFCTMLRDLNDPRLIVVEDSAEKISEYLTQNEMPHIDAAVSALPLVVLPKPLTEKVLQAIQRHLKADGLFVQLSYSAFTYKKFDQYFKKLNTKFEIRNIPPAFVFVCKKLVPKGAEELVRRQGEAN